MTEALEITAEKTRSLVEGFFWLLPNLAIAVPVFGLFLAAAAGARRLVLELATRRQREDFGALLAAFVRSSLIFFGLLVAATIVFPSIAPADILSSTGVGTVAIGFAFRDVLQNWLAGLLILYRRPFRRGDQIRSGEFEGTVDDIEARATIIRTDDGQRTAIPNSDIYTRAVTVRTAFPTRRSEIDVGIDYDDDLDRAAAVILAALGRVEGVVADPPPDAIPWSLDPLTVGLEVRWWSDSRRASVVTVQGRVVRAIMTALHEAGIDLRTREQLVLFRDRSQDGRGRRSAGQGAARDRERER